MVVDIVLWGDHDRKRTGIQGAFRGPAVTDAKSEVRGRRYGSGCVGLNWNPVLSRPQNKSLDPLEGASVKHLLHNRILVPYSKSSRQQASLAFAPSTPTTHALASASQQKKRNNRNK